MANTAHAHAAEPAGETRRDFLLYTATGVAAVGGAMMVWPLIDSMNPAADTLSLSTTEVNVAGVAEGSRVVVMWRGTPVFVAHRTAAEIEAAEKVNISELRDPQKDEARVQKPEFLIVSGVCTHLGCVPLGSKATDPKGEFGGWFCPCHGSQYDTSGRIRLGPAPKNLEVPPYKFTGDTTVLIG
ncbi:MAG: ubiquinol-cytochrome c reductase iron-sulfur subunit [Rhodospirillaceae bacterium]|nr:ubiquinol-cytochrome c reductase iron-sulfur subunit [Rhodospirillaceae bacterium]